eukprot:scaffold136047_cov37-Tisochrysis_lutea.AAC.1
MRDVTEVELSCGSALGSRGWPEPLTSTNIFLGIGSRFGSEPALMCRSRFCRSRSTLRACECGEARESRSESSATIAEGGRPGLSNLHMWCTEMLRGEARARAPILG